MSDCLTYAFGLILLAVFLLMNWFDHKQTVRKKEQFAELVSSREECKQELALVDRVMQVVAMVAEDATGIPVQPDQLRLEDCLDSDLQLGLDSLSFFNLEAELSREFGIHFKLPGRMITEPTIGILVLRVEELVQKGNTGNV
ncbi:MAG: hypothetical protein JNJ77_20170 [Planctomycetia bacterium]|nr:hypothetical protein [Planctomycetia bacterium]